MNCQELYAKLDRATIPPLPMMPGEQDEAPKARLRLQPIAIYLGDDEYRSVLNDRRFRDYGNMPNPGEPWKFVGVPMYNVKIRSHCYIATKDPDAV